MRAKRLARWNVALINQTPGPLFRQLVRSFAEAAAPVAVFGARSDPSGHPGEIAIHGPRFRGRNLLMRAVGWAAFTLSGILRLLFSPGRPLLVISSNPPIAPVIGWVCRKLRGLRYIVLVYDIYPEVGEITGHLSRGGIIARFWRALNHATYSSADAVITLTTGMAATLRQYQDRQGRPLSAVVASTWVDTAVIRRTPKADNEFASRNDQTGRLTLMYSGNLGLLHDLSMLPEMMARLSAFPDIHLMIIGDGPGRRALAEESSRRSLDNVTFLPSQDERQLSQVLATADIALVALAHGCEAVCMPSKTYYHMAAGSALLGISGTDSDLAQLIRGEAIGVNVDPKNVDAAVGAILAWRADPALLERHRQNARLSAELRYDCGVGVERILEVARPFLHVGGGNAALIDARSGT